MKKDKIAEMKQQMRVSMFHAMVDLLGRGYTPDYYESAASDFISIAEDYIDKARRSKKPNYYGIKIDDAALLADSTVPQLFRKRSIAVTKKRMIIDRHKFAGRKLEVVRLILQEAE